MFLLDATYINSSGGLELLKYLIATLNQQNVKGIMLLDYRVKDKIPIIGNSDITVSYIKASEKRRKFFYKRLPRIDSILCFGNVPPPIRVNAKIYTYFHNIFLLKIPHAAPLLTKIKWKIKQIYIYSKKNNTDFWIVQTENTATELKQTLRINNNVLVLPFYDISSFACPTFKRNRTDYIFVANYIPAKNHRLLIAAWRLLAEKGIYPTLHLTLSDPPSRILDAIDIAKTKGARIVNHGFCNKQELKDLYNRSKVTIYPSENESFGLGIIEAIECGCDVLGPNHPFIYSICSPSGVFDYNAESIAHIIESYEDGILPRTSISTKNSIQTIINILIT